MLNFQVKIYSRFTYSCGRPKSIFYIFTKKPKNSINQIFGERSVLTCMQHILKFEHYAMK
jgi:hypothetical protein